MQPNVIKSGPGPNGLPDMVEPVATVASVRVLAGEDPGTALPTRHGFEKPDGRRGEPMAVREFRIAKKQSRPLSPDP